MSDEQTFILTPAARAGLDAAWIRILNERHPGLRFRVVREERDVLTDRPVAVAPANPMIHPSN